MDGNAVVSQFFERRFHGLVMLAPSRAHSAGELCLADVEGWLTHSPFLAVDTELTPIDPTAIWNRPARRFEVHLPDAIAYVVQGLKCEDAIARLMPATRTQIVRVVLSTSRSYLARVAVAGQMLLRERRAR